MGLMHKLLEQALKNMREKKQYICYLYPYSIPYYRRKGWELISDKISYEIKDYQLPKNHQVAGSVRRVKADGEELKETYARFAEHTHGAILRDELAWNEYWLWDGTISWRQSTITRMRSRTGISSTGSKMKSSISRT